MKRAEVIIENESVSLEIEGDCFFGTDEVLLENDRDISSGTCWANVGYTIEPFLDETLNEKIILGIEGQVLDVLNGVESSNNILGFSLDKYHQYVDDTTHSRVIEKTVKGFNVEEFPIPIKYVVERISEICGKSLGTFNRVSKRNLYHVRIARPNSFTDGNPPHRDVWLDSLRNGINIYVPMKGSDSRSSLGLIPSSHRWRESDIERTSKGAKVGSISYHVPSVTNTKQPFKLIRPNPKMGEVMVFSPYLVHGLGINFNENITRSSLEIRFWQED